MGLPAPDPVPTASPAQLPAGGAALSPAEDQPDTSGNIVKIPEDAALPERSNFDAATERQYNLKDVAQDFPQLAKGATLIGNQWVSALQDHMISTDDPPDPNYDPGKDVGEYGGIADQIIQSKSALETFNIKQRFDQDMQIREDIAASGWEGFAATVVSGFSDPTMFIPLGGEIGTYRETGNILKGALRTGAEMGGIVSAQQTVLQATEPTHTMEESAANVTGAMMLAGVLGGAIHALPSGVAKDLSKGIESQMHVPLAPGDTSVGAMAAPTTTLAQEGIKDTVGLKPLREPVLNYLNEKGAPDWLKATAEKGLKNADEVLAFQDPIGRMTHSPSVVTRRMAEQLAEVPLIKNKNTEGVASDISVQNKIDAWNLPKNLFYKAVDSHFLDYREANSLIATKAKDALDSVASKVTGQVNPAGKLNYQEFGQAIIDATHNNDEHEIPQVAAAARDMRKYIFDQHFDAAHKVGLVDDETYAAAKQKSYSPHMYDKPKIMANLQDFRDINEKWLTQKRDEAVQQFEALQKEHAGAETKSEEVQAQLDDLKQRAAATDAELKDTAYQLTDRVLGTPVGRLSYDNKLEGFGSGVSTTRGSLKARKYDIPYSMVKDYLTNDLTAVTEGYTRSMAPDIELYRKFGNLDAEAQLKEIQDHYARLAEGKTEAQATKLKRQQDADLRDFKGVWDRLRGTFGHNGSDDYASAWNSAQRIAMNVNYMAQLGGAGLTTVSDIGKIVMNHGITRTFGDLIFPMLSNLKDLKMSKQDLMEASVATEMMSHSRSRALAGLDEYQPFTNRLDQATGKAAKTFSSLSLISGIHGVLKQGAGIMTQTRMLRAINKLAAGAELPQAETEWLAANFIDKKMAMRIAKEFDAHGGRAENVLVPNARAWKDIQAAEIFRAGVRRDVNRTITTPGQDKPFWISKSGWKLLGQFRSFALASTQRTLLSGLQQKDMAAMMGLVTSIGLGAAVYVTKARAYGYDVEDSPGRLIAEGLDRSGTTGWFMDANNVVEKLSRERIGLNPLLGSSAPLSRYASRSALEAVYGPTYGMLGNLNQVAGSALSNDWRQADTHTLRRLMPYQNHLLVKRLFDEAEQNINNTLGVKK